MQHPNTDTWNNYINKRKSEWSLESLFSWACNFLEAYVTARGDGSKTFTFNDINKEKSCLLEKDNVQMINWWLTYSESGKKLREILRWIESRIPPEWNGFTIRSLWDISKWRVPWDLFAKFITELFQFYIHNWPVISDAISRARKEKALILFMRLGFLRWLWTDQEIKNVHRRLLNVTNNVM
jgi:hypothetical protein